MKSATLITLAVALALAAPASARVRCDQRAGATLSADAAHRVYTRTQQSKHDPDANTIRLYACATGSRKSSRRLDTFKNTLDGELTPVRIHLARRWALLESDEATGVTDGHSLRLYDLRTGKQGGSLYVDGSDNLDAVLTTHGAYAVNLPEHGGLLAFDAAGQRTLAPTATDLAAAGARVYWTAGGVAASAVLGDAPTKDVDLE